MQKFTIKLFIALFIMISLMFFSLVTFQKATMDHQAALYSHYEFSDIMPAPKEPPAAIPIILILGISSIFIYMVCSYIDKKFVYPLILIKENLKRIKNDDYNLNFGSGDYDNSVIEAIMTLEETAAELKQKKELQKDFIEKIVHDLRTPAVAQERAITILKDEFKDHELFDGLIKNSENYLKLINLILETFRERPKQLEKSKFDLNKLADIIITVLTPSASAKGITITNGVPENFLIYADYLSMNRILTNLISNAIENIQENKSIVVKARKENSNAEIVVEDNGCGIAQKDIENIFNKYYSNKTNIMKGLGLYITKELVLKNGGTISVESKEDVYTKFIIEVPDNKNN